MAGSALKIGNPKSRRKRRKTMICASLKKWWFPTRWVNHMKNGIKSLMKHEIELLINKLHHKVS